MNGEWRFNGRIIAAAVITLFTALASMHAISAAEIAPSLAPANPKFISYVNDAAAGIVQQTEEGGHTLGLVPLPVNLPQVKPKPQLRAMTLVGMPSSYDLHTLNKLTNVRDQGSCGACWAFATYGSMESALMPYEARDFSENNMKNTSGFDLSCCAGGNYFMSTAYLSRWAGPSMEAEDPFDSGSCSSLSLPALKHLQAVDFIADRTGPMDNDTLKRAVMSTGAVYTSFYWSGSYFNPSTNAYCYSGSAVVNHAVCIVGWDDNFDRNRFGNTPAGDGAFLIKNSWGPNWGINGYFWISYYDSKIGTENASFRVAEPSVNYSHVYQYDPLGWVQSSGFSANTAWFANIFTCDGDQALEAVSFYSPVPDASCEISVYLDPSGGPTSEAGPVSTQVGGIANSGYQTVALNAPVNLAAGQRFSVVVKLTTPGYNYPIPIESISYGYSGQARANLGESYISPNGQSWTDMTTPYPNANACLKAFTVDRAGLLVSPASSLSATGPVGGPFNPSIQAYTLRNEGTTDLDWTATKNSSWVDISTESGLLHPGESTSVDVSINSSALAFDQGGYSDTVLFTNATNGVGSTSRAVSLGIREGSLSVTPRIGLTVQGEPGGPFSPSAQTYTLKNTGYGGINWQAAHTETWIGLSDSSGYLEAGESANVTVSVSPAAAGLFSGDYSDLITFTNATNGDGNTTRPVNLNIVRNYKMSAAPYAWVDPSAHPSFALSDDGVTNGQTIPFAFSFYGNPYSELYVGANGLLGFGSAGLDEYQNTDIPSSTLPNAAIYPYWDDLNPSVGGAVHVGTVGVAPNRRMVISWLGVKPYYSSYPLDFQVLLCETTNDIIFQYQEVQQEDTIYGSGLSATIGIENSLGSIARKYSFDGSAPLSNGQAILFTLNPAISLAEAKRVAAGASCSIEDAIVTAVISSSLFYVEAENRGCGIAVYKPQHSLAPDMIVNIVGSTQVSDDGEKFINAVAAVDTGEALTLKPVTMANSQLGGAEWFYDADTKAGQQGIKDSIYLNNIGLLVTTPGRVTSSGSGYFYIDDGSACEDDSGHAGVKVLGTVPVGVGEDPVGKYVWVTGVSSCFMGVYPDTDLYRMIRATDIQVVQ